MTRRDFLKLLGLTTAGALLPGIPALITTIVAGTEHQVKRTDVGDVAFFQGLPVLYASGEPCCTLPAKGNYELRGSVKVGENLQAAWVLT